MSETILRLPEVMRRTGLAKPTIYLYMRNGTFPKTVALGVRSVGWRESDIAAWIDSRKPKNDGAANG